MTTCSNCGRSNDPEQKVCGGCGVILGAIQQTQPPLQQPVHRTVETPPKKDIKVSFEAGKVFGTGIAFLVIAIVGIVLCNTIAWGTFTFIDSNADANVDIAIDDEGKIEFE